MRTLLAGTALAAVMLTVGAASGEATTDTAARVAAYVHANGTRYTFGTYTDPATGRVVLETDAPAKVIAAVSGPGVLVRHTGIKDTLGGGAGITAGGAACTSGYTVRNRVGALSMVTAGHCFANGQTVTTSPGGAFFGTVTGNGLPTHDMELLTGGAYTATISVNGVATHVASAADPVVGYPDYCHSGRVTGSKCGHTVNSVNAMLCTATGCKSPVVAFTGGTLPAAGDSGAPFYVSSGGSVHIRGHVIATSGTTGYAEKYSRVAARYGVTIYS